MALLEPGSKSSELKLLNRIMVAGVVIAVLASFGKVPWTPGQVGEYLQGVMTEATEWAKTLTPYVAGMWAFYASVRTYLKQRALDNDIKPKYTD